MNQVNQLGIDCKTSDIDKLREVLKSLSTTHKIYIAGEYYADLNYSQLWIDTEWSEDELDDWLYNFAHNCDYVGVWVRNDSQEIYGE